MIGERMRVFVRDKYGIDATAFNATTLTIFGLYLVRLEKQEMGSATRQFQDEPEDQESCFITAITSLIGLTEAKAIWKALVSGGIAETAVGALKLIAKRVGIVVTATYAIYEAGKCLKVW